MREGKEVGLLDEGWSRSSRRPWIVLAVLIVVAAAAGYFVLRPKPAEQAAAPAPSAPAPAAEPMKPLGGEGASIVLPPIDESDTVVADLVRKLSTHPRVAAWLTTRGLVRNFAVVVLNIAEGNTPSSLIRPLRPTTRFTVIERGRDVYIDPRSYERYDSLADAVASIDAKGSADLYATVKPRLEEANHDLGELATSFDRTLERAIVMLLKTPIPERSMRVEPHGIGYEYADRKLEDLTAAQKQLLRMGPENARRVQAKLREIALALGIPAERLPSSSARLE